ncbi:MAG: M20 family metallopeptidase [Gemmatimonadetes bacterium]|nr:M20 family metallopeptidase [Gemmatimonadota bacterium]
MSTVRLASALLALAVCSPAASAQLTRPEQAIAQAVDRRNAESLALLERIVNINSGSFNLAGVRAVGDVLRREYDALGFTTEWVDGAPYARAGHLVAERKGTGPKILLIGHLDTVFEPSSPFQKFERLNDSTARGPGIIDMKGGNVIILQALKALRDAGRLATMHIVVVLNGDEEESGDPMMGTRSTLIEAARGAAVAIGFEDGAGDPKTAVIGRRGTTIWKLTTTGQAGHASQIFRADLGAGALNEAARIINEFYQTLAGEQYLAFSGGLALGGSGVKLDSTLTLGSAEGKTNVIAQQMVITGDMRTISAEQLARTKERMREIVARNLPKTTATIEFIEGYPPLAPTDGNRRLLAMYDRAAQDLGTGSVAAVDPSRAGAADVSFVAGIVPMIIDGVGLSGRDGHSASETADLNWLPRQAKRAALLLSRITDQQAALPRP